MGGSGKQTKKQSSKRASKLVSVETDSRVTVREETRIDKRAGGNKKSTSYVVQGWKTVEGKRGRKRFSDQDEAENYAATKRIEEKNKENALHNVVTFLTTDQVREAEGAFHRLSGKHGLDEVVEFFLKNYASPDQEVSIYEAYDRCVTGKRKDGVRARSLVQLASTIRAFEAYIVIEEMGGKDSTMYERAKLKLESQRLATPDEIARKLPLEQRPAFRKCVRDLDASTAKDLHRLFESMDKEVADAVESARNQIEKSRIPRPWEVVHSLRAEIRQPLVHETTTRLVESFLQSLRSKDGSEPITRKTWNNYRADLHSFFAWCAEPQRRWVTSNPATPITKYRIERGMPDILTTEQTKALMDYVANHDKGVMVPFFALALFAGLRTGPDGELHKLAKHEERDKFINLEQGVIHVQPEISKTGQYRQVVIRPNLMAWLQKYGTDILPANSVRKMKEVRQKFELTHDVLRHTFFSMHVAAFKSIGEAALEGGNTEQIIRRHYLNLTSLSDGESFWKVGP